MLQRSAIADTICRTIELGVTITDAALDGDVVVVRSPRAGSATHVRYCWADGPVCTLRDTAGLPAGPFERSLTTPEVPR